VTASACPRFRHAIAGAIAILLASAVPSRAQSASPVAPASPSYREVADETGRTVRIPQPLHRIVSLAPSLTETVYALGLQDSLVGDTDYCDYPAAAQKKTKVGGGINPSLEIIASLHPDLVLVTKSFNRLETVNSLASLGISSYATDPHTIDEIISSSKKLSDVLGAPDAGASIEKDMQRRLADLQKRLASLSPKRVLFVVWTQPLISIGKDTFIADALRRAGAVSIVDSDQSWPQVSLEEVAHLQPDFLIFADSHSVSVTSSVEMLATLPGWSIVDAVANRRFAVISDAVNRPAPRIISAIEDLARQLHPDAFREKPDDTKGRIENESSPLGRPPSLQSSFLPDAPQALLTGSGGCPCAR
jgi:iron complex transport system substrate-binding protein